MRTDSKENSLLEKVAFLAVASVERRRMGESILLKNFSIC
jgi:hypothetical protein